MAVPLSSQPLPAALSIRELPRSERPRERLVSLGAAALSSAELLALLVGAISPLPADLSLPAVLLGIFMSKGVGVFFGSYPAFRAARLDPIEALRYE